MSDLVKNSISGICKLKQMEFNINMICFYCIQQQVGLSDLAVLCHAHTYISLTYWLVYHFMRKIDEPANDFMTLFIDISQVET